MHLLFFLVYAGVSVYAYPGIYYSGDGSGEQSEELETCDICLTSIRDRLVSSHDIQGSHCEEVSKVTECFERCTPRVPPSTDPNNIEVLKMMELLSKIFSILEAENCEINEETAPGCDQTILDCIKPLTLVNTYTDSLRKLYCSDTSILSLLECTERIPDCEWRTNIEMIASLSRKSLCYSHDKCMAGGIMYVVSPGSSCTRFKLAALNNLQSLASQQEQQTAPGTKFDVSICGLQHSALVPC
ncbi:hypothetical protein EB796_005720 [Bugula neritina]|uniref:Uncharacterized protein n=1 Tax=Bugula neritina TaxID=10212 RepID=A0A7J7KCR0_BUGNE|nr:hypothetical protein EB796_005720 [Bugula neritina]